MTDPLLVKTELDRGILRVTLDSPHNRNALSLALVEQLVAAFERAKTEPEVRAVVLTHTGPTFCAGADLKEDPSRNMTRAAKMIDMFHDMGASPVPVVVELHGNVRAGGLGMLGAADIVVAPDNATFAFTEVRIGVVAALIAVPILPRMDARAAQRYFLTGEEFDANEAVRNGLITMVAPAADVAKTVEGLLDCFRKSAPSAVAKTKELLRERTMVKVDRAGLESAAALSASIFASDDAREGMLAFREKRPPRWAL